MKAFCELTEDRKRIEVHFLYSPEAVAGIKTIGGAHFVPREKGGPHWTLPLDLQSGEKLREVFGDGLELGAAVTEWGREQRAEVRNLTRLAKAADAKLKVLPEVLPELAEFYRPYQRADVAFMAQANILNANEPGLGKTVEAIGAVFEAELDNGPQLVVAPKTSLRLVWQFELDKWVGDPVYILSGDTPPGQHLTDIGKMRQHLKRDEPFWFITTAAQIRRGLNHILATLKWKAFIIDEFHTTGLTNVSGDFSKGTAFGRAVRDIQRERLLLVSGTPMGGKPIKLWGSLHHMYPDRFTSKWRWAEEWLEITDNGYGKIIGGLRKDRVDDFYPAHAQYIVRRLTAEVAPELPEINRINVWCEMLPAQRKQYDKMEANAEVRIEEERLSALGVLAEYTRLKQFSNAECKIERKKRLDKDDQLILHPKASGKFEHLLQKLDERGIRPARNGLEPEGEEVAVVASQSREYVEWLTDQLNKEGIKAEKITGKISEKKRTDLVRRFQAQTNAPRVLVIVTTAGGVSITLDRADSVHIMDETWDPDDQHQVERRCLRISRIHHVTAYYYRSKNSIEEAIREVVGDKAITQKNILDIRRQIFQKEKVA